MTLTLTEFTYDEVAENGIEFNSDAIETVAYNREDKELFVEFQSGGEYVYKGVEESTYGMFVEAPSLGRFWRAHIEGEYGGGVKGDYELVEREPDLQPTQRWLTGGPQFVNDDEDDDKDVPVVGPSRFGVKWTNGTLTMEPQFEALSEAEALVKFDESVKHAEKILPEQFASVKILAVTHYFD